MMNGQIVNIESPSAPDLPGPAEPAESVGVALFSRAFACNSGIFLTAPGPFRPQKSNLFSYDFGSDMKLSFKTARFSADFQDF
jgi:hypothetical protein